jgi:hypothetical protein
MGKATIKTNIGEGQYLVDVAINTGMKAPAIATYDRLIAVGEAHVPIVQAALEKQEAETARLQAVKAGIITEIEAVQGTYRAKRATLDNNLDSANTAVSNAQIEVDDAAYLLALTQSSLAALEAEKAAIEALPPPANIPSPALLEEIALAQAEILLNQADLDAKKTVLAAAKKARDGIQSQIDNLKNEIPKDLTDRMGAVIAEIQTSQYAERLFWQDKIKTLLDIKGYRLKKAEIEKLPDTKEVSAWCADYSTTLTGDVATIEVAGEVGAVPILLKPAFEVPAFYDSHVDGGLVNLELMSPEQAWFNLCTLPYLNKWRPRFRRGHITSITGDLCEVALEETLTKYHAVEVTPKGKAVLKAVPFVYMSCNAAAFVVGDFVIIAFTDRDPEKPKVVGFVENPRSCNVIFCNPKSVEHPDGFGNTIDKSGVFISFIKPNGQGIISFNTFRNQKINNIGSILTTSETEPGKYEFVTFNLNQSNWLAYQDTRSVANGTFYPLNCSSMYSWNLSSLIYKRNIICNTPSGVPLSAKTISVTLPGGSKQLRTYVFIQGSGVYYSVDLNGVWVNAGFIGEPVWTNEVFFPGYTAPIGYTPTRIIYSRPEFNSDCTELVWLETDRAIPDSSMDIAWPIYKPYYFYAQKYLIHVTGIGSESGPSVSITRLDADQGGSGYTHDSWSSSERIEQRTYDPSTGLPLDTEEGLPSDVLVVDYIITSTFISNAKAYEYVYFNSLNAIEYVSADTNANVVDTQTGTQVFYSVDIQWIENQSVTRTGPPFTDELTGVGWDDTITLDEKYYLELTASIVWRKIMYMDVHSGLVLIVEQKIPANDNPLVYKLYLKGALVTTHYTNSTADIDFERAGRTGRGTYTNTVKKHTDDQGRYTWGFYDPRFGVTMFSAKVAPDDDSTTNTINYSSYSDLPTLAAIPAEYLTDAGMTFFPMNPF